METRRWCHCQSKQGPSPCPSTNSLCYTLRRACRRHRSHPESCKPNKGVYVLHLATLDSHFLFCDPRVSALTRCMRRWVQPRGCCRTWCQTAAAAAGTPWRTWWRRAELQTPGSACTSSSADHPGRSPLPLQAGSTHLEYKHLVVATLMSPYRIVMLCKTYLLMWCPSC